GVRVRDGAQQGPTVRRLDLKVRRLDLEDDDEQVTGPGLFGPVHGDVVAGAVAGLDLRVLDEGPLRHRWSVLQPELGVVQRVDQARSVGHLAAITIADDSGAVVDAHLELHQAVVRGWRPDAARPR